MRNISASTQPRTWTRKFGVRALFVTLTSTGLLFQSPGSHYIATKLNEAKEKLSGAKGAS